ncbi:MAG: hypothetical protein QMC89_06355 [Candidatus Hodarchaeaceae archaeon]|nr:hypothetical protein [Candidatus Hodarchaeaceae archaeon]
MALEPWQIMHITIALVGLLIGWRFNPWFGVVFIWAIVIAVEAFSSKKKGSRGSVAMPSA